MLPPLQKPSVLVSSLLCTLRLAPVWVWALRPTASLLRPAAQRPVHVVR